MRLSTGSIPPVPMVSERMTGPMLVRGRVLHTKSTDEAGLSHNLRKRRGILIRQGGALALPPCRHSRLAVLSPSSFRRSPIDAPAACECFVRVYCVLPPLKWQRARQAREMTEGSPLDAHGPQTLYNSVDVRGTSRPPISLTQFATCGAWGQ